MKKIWDEKKFWIRGGVGGGVGGVGVGRGGVGRVGVGRVGVGIGGVGRDGFGRDGVGIGGVGRDGVGRGGGGGRSHIHSSAEDFSGNMFLPEESPKTGSVSQILKTNRKLYILAKIYINTTKRSN